MGLQVPKPPGSVSVVCCMRSQFSFCEGFQDKGARIRVPGSAFAGFSLACSSVKTSCALLVMLSHFALSRVAFAYGFSVFRASLAMMLYFILFRVAFACAVSKWTFPCLVSDNIVPWFISHGLYVKCVDVRNIFPCLASHHDALVLSHERDGDWVHQQRTASTDY